MTVSVLLEQPCNKSDNPIKLVTSYEQLVPNLFKKLVTSSACGNVCNNLHSLTSLTLECHKRLIADSKTRKVVTNLFTSCQQVVFALFVPSLL